MAKNYVQPGDVLDFVAGSAISSEDVVTIGPVVGIALADIANGETGSVQIVGVFDVPKAAGAVTVGQLINYDASASNFTTSATSATGDVTGGCVAVAAAASGDATVRVKLLPGSGVLS